MATKSLIDESVSACPALEVPSARLFGLSLCTFDMQEVVSHVDRVLLAGGSRVLFTANVDHVVRYSRDPEFRHSYKAADMVFADGMPLMWAAKLLGTQVRARVTGVDLMESLCILAAGRNYRCFFLGASEATLDRACHAARKRFPGIQIAGWHHGYFDDSAPVLELIRQTHPHLLFIGMGSPRQEKWIAEHRHHLPGVALPVGGSFEIFAGEKKRAPQLMQRIGLEWIWRLGQDPRRLWKRYLWDDLAFLKLFLRELHTR
ncbi:MAG: WecB/TagA/CpsF family glycosyltransferase [Candidatus Angelobacter sp.]